MKTKRKVEAIYSEEVQREVRAFRQQLPEQDEREHAAEKARASTPT